jgi:hypothetical protein
MTELTDPVIASFFWLIQTLSIAPDVAYRWPVALVFH